MKKRFKNKILLLMLMFGSTCVVRCSGGSGGGGEAARSTGAEDETAEIRRVTEKLKRAVTNGTLNDRIALFTKLAPQCNPLLQFERGANLLESTMRAGCNYDKITRLLVQRIVDISTIFKEQAVTFLTSLKNQTTAAKANYKTRGLLKQIEKALADLANDNLEPVASQEIIDLHRDIFDSIRNKKYQNFVSVFSSYEGDLKFNNRFDKSVLSAIISQEVPIDFLKLILQGNRAVFEKDKTELVPCVLKKLQKCETKDQNDKFVKAKIKKLKEIESLLRNDPYQRFDIPVEVVAVAAVSSAAGSSTVAAQAVKPLKGLTSKRKSSSSSGPVIVKVVAKPKAEVTSKVIAKATNPDKGNHAAAVAVPAPVVVVQAPDIVAGLDVVDDLQDTPLSQEQERLLDAIISQNIEEIKTFFKEFPLVDLNFKTEFTDQSPLSLAAVTIRSSLIVKVLLEHGKNILASDKTELLDRINAQRFAASGTAVQAGNVQVIEQLLLDSNKGFVYTSTPQNRRLLIQAGGSEPAGQSAESASAKSLSSADSKKFIKIAGEEEIVDFFSCLISMNFILDETHALRFKKIPDAGSLAQAQLILKELKKIKSLTLGRSQVNALGEVKNFNAWLKLLKELIAASITPSVSVSSGSGGGGSGGGGSGGSSAESFVAYCYALPTDAVAVAPQAENKESEKKRQRRSATTKKSYREIDSDDDELSDESSYHDSDASDESSDSSL